VAPELVRLALISAAGVAFAATLVLVAGLRRRRASLAPSAVRDALIVAAHPDDCVIVAGEYGVEAVRAGRSVHVAYVTCGDGEPGTPRAEVRRQEALRAWALAGVDAKELHFFALPNSPMAGPLASSSDGIASAAARLAELVRELPADAAVFCPAAGETHVDHRLTRKLTIEAVVGSGRSDLTLFEAAEYNDFYSLYTSPERALGYVASNIPGLARFVPERFKRGRHGFASGAAGFGLSPDAERLAKKHAMLRAFASEDGELLVRLFGVPDLFRPIARDDLAMPEQVRGYITLGGRQLSWSTVALWLGLLGLVFGISGLAVELAARGFDSVRYVSLAAGALGAVLALRPRLSLERRLAVLSGAAGLLLGALGVTH